MMLNQIKSVSTRSSGSQDVAELLLACHQKIRHFSEVSVRLAHDGAIPKTIPVKTEMPSVNSSTGMDGVALMGTTL